MISVPGKPNIKKITVHTRLGNRLKNEQVWDDLSQSYKSFALKMFAKYLKDVYTKPINTESQIYNCHGLTFGSRRTRLFEVDKILKEDSYKRIDKDEVHEGDVAIYIREEGVVHSGIVIGVIHGNKLLSQMPLILSKWGVYGEYVHRYNCCPYIETSQDVIFYRIQNEKRNKRDCTPSDGIILVS